MQPVRSSNSRERAPKMTFHHLQIVPAKNGGVSVHHIGEKDGYVEYSNPMETHVFGADEGHEALMHIAEHAGIKHDMLSHPEAEDEHDGAIADKKDGGA